MDEIERRRVEGYLKKYDEENVWGGESNDDNNSEINEELHSNHNTDSEQSDNMDISDTDMSFSFANEGSFHESDDDITLNIRVQFLLGKGGTKWYRKKPNKKKTSRNTKQSN